MDLDAVRRRYVDRYDLLGLLWHLHVVANPLDPRRGSTYDRGLSHRGCLVGVLVASMVDAIGMIRAENC